MMSEIDWFFFRNLTCTLICSFWRPLLKLYWDEGEIHWRSFHDFQTHYIQIYFTFKYILHSNIFYQIAHNLTPLSQKSFFLLTSPFSLSTATEDPGSEFTWPLKKAFCGGSSIVTVPFSCRSTVIHGDMSSSFLVRFRWSDIPKALTL